jgi:hypothetical protein
MRDGRRHGVAWVGRGDGKHGRALLEAEGAAALQAPDCCVNRKPEEQWGSGHRAFREMGGIAPQRAWGGIGGAVPGGPAVRVTGPALAEQIGDARAWRDGMRGFVNTRRRYVIGAGPPPVLCPTQQRDGW